MVVGIALFFIVFSLNLLSMPTIMQQNGDAVYETQLAAAGTLDARPNHLLISPIYALWYRIVSPLSPSEKPFFVLQVLTSLFGALSCLLIYQLVKRWTGRTDLLAPTIALLVSVCFSHWEHSRETETEIIGLCMSLLTFYLLVKAVPSDERYKSWIWTFFAGLSCSLSILCSFNMVLFFFGFSLFFLLFASHWKSAVKPTIFFILVSCIPTLAIYILTYLSLSSRGDYSGFFGWLLTHPEGNDGLLLSGFGASSIIRGISGISNYFSGYSPITTYVKSVLSGGVRPEIVFNDVLNFGLGIFLLAALFCSILWLSFRHHRKVKKELVFFAILVSPTVIFNFLWLGSDPQFWIVVMPLCFIYLSVLSNYFNIVWQKRIAPIFLSVAFVLFFANYQMDVPTSLNPTGGRNWVRATHFSNTYCNRCTIITASAWTNYLNSQTADARAIEIYYGIREKNLEQYTEQLHHLIDASLRDKKEVFLSEIHEINTKYAINLWERVKQRSGFERSLLVEQINKNYDITPIGDPKYGNTLAKITPRQHN